MTEIRAVKTFRLTKIPTLHLEVVYDRQLNDTETDPLCLVEGRFYAPHYWISKASWLVYAIKPQHVEQAKSVTHLSARTFHHEFDTEGECPEDLDFDTCRLVVHGLE